MGIRSSDLSRSLEDYLEAIYNLKACGRVARVKDIAQEMAVKMPSVTEAIRALASRGMVKHKPYESVELTEDGLERARGVARSHSAVKEFLTSVLVLDEQDAEAEACGIEHAIRPETLSKLLEFTDFIRACKEDKSLRIEHFQYHMRHGEYPRTCALAAGTRQKER